jgi:4-amino-4-deoxy-L-arabinose transferase-like glycosyltransferase
VKTRLTTFGKLSSVPLPVLLFLLLWFAYGAAINSSNLLEFNLQQIGVEAMVERGHFYLEGSTSPHLQTRGDVFEYKGHKYAAKQPGQFMAGAIIYSLLHKLGLDYANNYLLTSALITFFTTSLVLAASGVALFEIAREMTADRRDLFWPLAATLSYALATTAFAYSGIAHHDALATGYLVIAFYLILQLSRGSATKRASHLKAAGAGFLLGLTITTSMLPFFIVVVCVLYFLSLRRWKLLPIFLAGVFAGLLPLFVYDAVNFSNPFLLPNIAGHYSDTYFHVNPTNFGKKVVFYARALLLYVPIFLLALFGLSYFPRTLKRESQFLGLVAIVIVIGFYVFNIDTYGDCQFGPRYLLPAMPFACLGIVGYSYLSRSFERQLAGIIVMIVGAVSFVINVVGALQGAMCCPDGTNAFLNHVSAIRHGELRSYPLAPWLLIPLAIYIALFLWTVVARRSGENNAD